MGWRITRRKHKGEVSPGFQLEIRDEGRRIRISLDTDDEEVADKRARDQVNAYKARKLAREYGSLQHEDTAAASIVDLCEELGLELKRLGRTREHRETVCKSVCRLCDEMGVTSLAEITPQAIRRALASMTQLPKHFETRRNKKAPEREKKSPKLLAARGQNRYRSALSQLFRFLIRQGRWDSNPCDQVEHARIVPGEAEAERRALRPEELRALLEKTPQHRALVYRVASTTGLRRDELDALLWSDVDLDARRLVVRASQEKARRGAVLPFPISTARAWAVFREQGLSFHAGRWNGREQSVWERRLEARLALPPIPAVRTLKRDLGKAEVIVGEGWKIDLHALRVSFGTNLARVKTSLQQAQKLMRHSSPALTANVYSKLEMADGQAAVEALDALIDSPVPDSANEEQAS